MKKLKNLSFALYVVAIIVVIFVVIAVTSSKDNGSNNSNNNPANNPQTGNPPNISNSTENSINLVVNCSLSYTINVNSKLEFGTDFYSCEKDVVTKVVTSENNDNVKFENNEFSTTSAGEYSIGFYVDNEMIKSITIIVTDKVVTTEYKIGEIVNLDTLNNDYDTVNISNNNFSRDDKTLTATTTGKTNIEFSKAIDSYVSVVESYTLTILPKFTIYTWNSEGEEVYLEEDTLTVYTNGGDGMFMIQVETSLGNSVYCDFEITCVNDDDKEKITFYPDAMTSFTASDVSFDGPITVVAKANGTELGRVTFNLVLQEEM